MLTCPNCGQELNLDDYMYRDGNRAVIGCENCIETVRAEIALEDMNDYLGGREMGFSLYEIDRRIMALVDPETGEIVDGAAFDQLQLAREDKLEGIACFIKNTVAEAAAIKAEEDALAARRKVLENRAQRLKSYLADALGGEKFQTAKCSVTFRRTTRVEVSEPALAVAWAQTNGYVGLVNYKAPEISKTDLGQLLKSGIEVPGAELVEGLSMGVK